MVAKHGKYPFDYTISYNFLLQSWANHAMEENERLFNLLEPLLLYLFLFLLFI